MRRLGVILSALGDDEQRRQLTATRQQLREAFPTWDQMLVAERTLKAKDLGVEFRATRPARRYEVEVLGKASVSYVPLESPLDAAELLTRVNQLSPWLYSLYLATGSNIARLAENDWQAIDLFPVAVGIHTYRTVGRAVTEALKERLLSPEEAAKTLEVCGSDNPFFATNVLYWRRCLVADLLFAAWHNEWKRYSQQAEFAFARALATTHTPIAILRRSAMLSENDSAIFTVNSTPRPQSSVLTAKKRLVQKKKRGA